MSLLQTFFCFYTISLCKPRSCNSLSAVQGANVNGLLPETSQMSLSFSFWIPHMKSVLCSRCLRSLRAAIYFCVSAQIYGFITKVVCLSLLSLHLFSYSSKQLIRETLECWIHFFRYHSVVVRCCFCCFFFFYFQEHQAFKIEEKTIFCSFSNRAFSSLVWSFYRQNILLWKIMGPVESSKPSKDAT